MGVDRDVQRHIFRYNTDRVKRRAGIPGRFLRAAVSDIEDAPTALVHYDKTLHSRISQGNNLLLVGPVGTGKTHSLCGLVSAALSRGYLAHYTTMIQMMTRIRSTYSRAALETEAQVVADLCGHELLAIDEVGNQRGSQAEYVEFFRIVDGRYAEGRPTLIASNLTRSELEEVIGTPAMDRLQHGGAVIPMDWHSYRRHHGTAGTRDRG